MSSSDDRTGLGQTGGDAVQIGVYWRREAWELASSAYVADLDCDPQSPAVFARWLVAVIEEHLARTPAERAATSKHLDKHSRGRGTSRAHRVGDHLISAIEHAIITDRRELGRVVSRSRFVLEAATAAAAEARDRRGRPLPPPPRRLVNRPPRRG